MGMATTNVDERVYACFGLLNGVSTKFEHCLDVENAGVLLCLPALLSNGLLTGIKDLYSLPPGYYTMPQIFILIAFLALCRIKSFEQLRYYAPGEWGKIMGLDRIPEVKTLRSKFQLLVEQKKAGEWSSLLSEQWMQDSPQDTGVLYVDGHVRVYHGKQTKLPRHYVARQKLCLRATVDYWVNALGGNPFFRINKAVDPGLIQVLTNEIVPRLIEDIPNQPTEQQLQQNPLLHRFTLVFDREGYSPDLFAGLKKQHIAVITYHKYPTEDWPKEEFSSYSFTDEHGNVVTMCLAERGIMLSNKLWVREIRKLSKKAHQTSILSTDYISDLKPIACKLFARWSQENFFKYMRENYNLDRLIDYNLEDLSDTTKLINPVYRDLDSKVRSLNTQINRNKNKFATLNLDTDIEEDKVNEYEMKKAELKQTIEQLTVQCDRYKQQRKQVPKHIEFKDLPNEYKFKQLATESKHLIDTIKMIAYRAETALASLLKPFLSNKQEARMIIKKLCISKADIIPDEQNKVVTVRLHHQTTHAKDKMVNFLCDQLNETQITFPGSDMTMHYELIE